MTVDPRFARSAAALENAVLRLAAERPIEDLSVSEIARAAHVSRATFYNHAESPEELLGRVLTSGLDAVREEFLAGVATRDLTAQWSASERALIAHIETHKDVFRTGLTPTQANRGTALSALMSRHFEATLLQFAEAAAPAHASDPAQRLRLQMEAAFAGHGLVGAIRAWLMSPEPHDPDAAAEILLEATPRYWFEIAADPAD